MIKDHHSIFIVFPLFREFFDLVNLTCLTKHLSEVVGLTLESSSVVWHSEWLHTKS